MMAYRPKARTIDKNFDVMAFPGTVIPNCLGSSLLGEVHRKGVAHTPGLLAQLLKRLFGTSTTEHGKASLSELPSDLQADAGRGPRD